MGIPSDRVTLFFLRMVLIFTPDGLSTLAYRPWQGSGWFCPVHPKGAGRFVLRRSSGRLDRPKQKTAPALCRSRCRASVRYERWAHWFSAAWYSGWNKESPMLWPDGNTSSRGNGISPESAREHQILPRYVPPACRKKSLQCYSTRRECENVDDKRRYILVDYATEKSYNQNQLHRFSVIVS